MNCDNTNVTNVNNVNNVENVNNSDEFDDFSVERGFWAALAKKMFGSYQKYQKYIDHAILSE